MPDTQERVHDPRVTVRQRDHERPVRLPEPEDEDREPREGQELLDAAARAGKEGGPKEKLTETEVVDATEWFLSDQPEDLTADIDINVGTPQRPRWAKWTIKPVDLDRLRRIRRQSQQAGRRQRGNTGVNFDADTMNMQVLLEGTVTPDLRALARQIGTVDPAVAVRSRFKHKPGLIDQIAGEILSLSGYDDDDVRETVDAARG